MLLRRSIPIILGVILLLAQQSICQSRNTDKSAGVNVKLVTLVRDILEGQNLEEAKTCIAPDAYVIDDTSFESLIAAMKGEFKNCKVIEGKGVRMEFEHLSFSPDRTSAYLTLIDDSPEKTKQFHTIVFFKESDGRWKIVSWHISR